MDFKYCLFRDQKQSLFIVCLLLSYSYASLHINEVASTTTLLFWIAFLLSDALLTLRIPPQVRAGLEQISTFLSTHSREVVFLDFNHFYGVQNLHHEKLVAMLKEVFGDKLCPVVFAQEVLSNSSPRGGNYSCWLTLSLAPIILLSLPLTICSTIHPPRFI